jgi:hypothetical protein
MNRTPDLLITNELLYRLSYTGVQAQNFTSNEPFYLVPDSILTLLRGGSW